MKQLSIVLLTLTCLSATAIFPAMTRPEHSPKTLPDGFVYLYQYYDTVIRTHKPHVKQILEHLRYATEENFTGEVVNGYSNNSRAVMTKEAAAAIYLAQEKALSLGFSLLVYDTYRPQKAVNFFVEWAKQPDNCDKCRKNYFPYLKNKLEAFELPDRYIARQSGHSRGSTVDLTLIKLGQSVIHPPTPIERELKNNQTVRYLYDGSVDMYTSFDLFHHASWPVEQDLIPNEPYRQHRNTLRQIMTEAGFVPLRTEWWHFGLKNEPFPSTFFDFEF